MPGIPSWLASLLGILLESIFYGIFFLLYMINLFCANGEKTVPVYRQRMVQVSTLMLILATAHLAIAFYRLVRGFTPVNGKVNIALFGTLYDPIYLAKIAIYFVQTIMADALMAWRCFVIYDRIWWILVPGIVGILLDVATMIVRLVPAKNPAESDPLGINGLIPLGCRIAFLSTTMTLHFATSAAIVIRIYLSRRSIQRHTTAARNLSPVILAIIESAAIYTIAVFLLLLFNLINSFGQFVVMDVIIPLGIVFCLIAIRIRVYLGISSTPCEGPVRRASLNSWSSPAIETVVDETASQHTPEHTSANSVQCSTGRMEALELEECSTQAGGVESNV